MANMTTKIRQTMIGKRQERRVLLRYSDFSIMAIFTSVMKQSKEMMVEVLWERVWTGEKMLLNFSGKAMLKEKEVDTICK